MPIARVHRLSATAPDDVAAIEAAIAAGTLDPHGIVAILGKTEGNGCVNDFTRAFAVTALQTMLHRHMAAEMAAKICLVMSGGTEGALAPHWLVLERAAKTGGVCRRLWRSGAATRRRSRPNISDGGTKSTWLRRACARR